MKVIENIELLKKLTPYLEDVETEYMITDTVSNIVDKTSMVKKLSNTERYLKTLTLEEAKEFIIEKVDMRWRAYIENELSRYVYDLFSVIEIFDIKMEKMLEYLIDNDLLWTNYNKK